MKKYPKSKFPTHKSKDETWAKFVAHHGFGEWHEMGQSVHDLAGDWSGTITYEHYCKWFEIYNSALFKALQEE